MVVQFDEKAKGSEEVTFDGDEKLKFILNQKIRMTQGHLIKLNKSINPHYKIPEKFKSPCIKVNSIKAPVDSHRSAKKSPFNKVYLSMARNLSGNLNSAR